MKKIFCVLLVMLTFVFGMDCASACSNEKSEVVTGGACSISELNNLEKEKRLQENNFSVKQKDLRPVSLDPKVKQSNAMFDGCFLGLCLSKKILDK